MDLNSSSGISLFVKSLFLNISNFLMSTPAVWIALSLYDKHNYRLFILQFCDLLEASGIVFMDLCNPLMKYKHLLSLMLHSFWVGGILEFKILIQHWVEPV